MQNHPPRIFTLATLPSVPGDNPSRPLTLTYDPQRSEGRFTYGEGLLMDYSATITRASQGSRNREERTTKQLQAQIDIPCTWLGSWLIYGANWPAGQHFLAEPFSYDPATQRWSTQYMRHMREAVFHDVHTTTIVIDIGFDLVRLQGWYTCTETYVTDD